MTELQLKRVAVVLAVLVGVMFASIVVNYPEFFTGLALAGMGIWSFYYIWEYNLKERVLKWKAE